MNYSALKTLTSLVPARIASSYPLPYSFHSLSLAISLSLSLATPLSYLIHYFLFPFFLSSFSLFFCSVKRKKKCKINRRCISYPGLSSIIKSIVYSLCCLCLLSIISPRGSAVQWASRIRTTTPVYLLYLGLFAQQDIMKNWGGYIDINPWGIPHFRDADFYHHCFRLKLALKAV